MTESLLTVKGVACRVCGAARAPSTLSEEAPPDICANCWDKFLWQHNRSDPDAPISDHFNRWLARNLFLQVRRLKKYKIIGRCECVSDWLYGRKGYQCAHPATALRDGRRVCTLHLEAVDPRYVGDGEATSPYAVMRDTMIEIARADKDFAAILKTAAETIAR